MGKTGNTALICLGIDPGVVNVFARYLCEFEFDTVRELHVKDGGNLTVSNAGPDDITFGFNVWTVLDEVMNPMSNSETASSLSNGLLRGKKTLRCRRQG